MSEIIIAFIFITYKELRLNSNAKQRCRIVKKTPSENSLDLQYSSFQCRAIKQQGPSCHAYEITNHNLVTDSDNKRHILTIFVPFLYGKKIMFQCILLQKYLYIGMQLSTFCIGSLKQEDPTYKRIWLVRAIHTLRLVHFGKNKSWDFMAKNVLQQNIFDAYS